jgi:hypothetical protein
MAEDRTGSLTSMGRVNFVYESASIYKLCTGTTIMVSLMTVFFLHSIIFTHFSQVLFILTR